MREEKRLSALELLRKIFRIDRVHITGQWNRLHSEDLCGLYSSISGIPLIKNGWRR